MTGRRYWIPEPVTAATRIYHLCRRCGVEVRATTGKQRLCRDCREVQTYINRDQAAELAASGVPTREIAEQMGVHRKTVGEWLRQAARDDKGGAVEACPDCRYHIGAPCTYHRQQVSA